MRSFVILLSALCCTFSLISQDVDPGFDPGFDEPGSVTAIAFDSEGNVYFTGDYCLVDFEPRSGITKLNSSARLVEDFTIGSGYNGTVTQLVTLSTDKLLVMGDFTEFNGLTTGPMVQLNLDGAVDEGFTTPTGIASSTQNPITNVIELPNGKLLAYGQFTEYNGFATNSMVILNQDGTVDESFSLQDENLLSVTSVALQSTGHMVVALRRSNAQSDLIVRLNADGSKDDSFNDADAGDDRVYKVRAQSTDKLIVLTDAPAGDQPNVTLFRLLADGATDDSFDLGAGIVGFFDDFQLDEDDEILIGFVSLGREAGTIDGNSTELMNRLSADGAFIRSAVQRRFIMESTKVTLNRSNRVFIYGYFPFLQSIDGQGIQRIDNNDQIDSNWRAIIKNVPETVLVAGSDSNPIIIPRFKNRLENIHYATRLIPVPDPMRNPWGRPFDVEEIRVIRNFPPEQLGFTAYGGGPRTPTGQNIVVMNQDDFRESSWDIRLNNINDNYVNDVAIDASGNVFLAGSFSGIGGQTDGLAGIIKFTTSSSAPVDFSPFSADTVKITRMQLQDDGKIVMSGVYAPVGETTLSNGLVRLNADGSFDETFDRSLQFMGGVIEEFVIMDDGYLVVGSFTGLNSATDRKGIAKINLDGTLNTEFNGDNSLVGNAMHHVVADGDDIYMGGDFTAYQGQAIHGLIKLDLDGNLDNTFRLPSTLSALVRDFEIFPGDEFNMILAGRFYDSVSNRKLSAIRLLEDLDGAPVNLTTGDISFDEVNLSWEETSTNEERYNIERSKNDQQNFEVIGWVDGNTTTYKDQLIFETGITHYYRVQATKGNFRSAYSNVVEAAIPQKPLAAPTDLNIWFSSAFLVRLRWQDASTEETGFTIERSENDQQNYVEIGTVAANENEFDDDNVEQGKTYFYRVITIKGSVSSEPSNVVEIEIPLTVPDAPSDLTGTIISANQIDLSWTDRSNNEDGFLILRTVNSGDFERIGPLPANSTSYSDTDVAPGEVLRYFVVATNNGGESSASNLIEISIPIPPRAPTNLSGNVTADNHIDLSWTDNSTREERFVITRNVDDEGFETIGSVPADETTYTDTDVELGQTLEYMVRASNVSGDSPPSDVFRLVIASIGEGLPSQDSRFDFTYDPVTAELRFKLNDPSDKIISYQVVASSGAMKVGEEDLQTQQISLNLAGNAPGVYLLHVISGRDKYVVKFLKE